MEGLLHEVVLACTDYSDRHVFLTSEVVTQIRMRHPEMEPFFGDVCDVVGSPDIVCYRESTSTYLFYKLGVLTGRLAHTYMAVIVWYDERDVGRVRTMYPTTRPASRDVQVHTGGQ